jgi:hypothetical protein
MGSGPVTTDPQSFGQRLARRVASPVPTHSLGMRYTTVGAVGRASLGFSRAVGRSQGIRPVVSAAELNTHALRPPPGFWGYDDVEVMRTHDPMGAAPSEQSLPSRRPVARPTTWTDRMLPKVSTSRSVPAAQRAAAPVAAAPPGLPTDSKFERMRKMFDARTGRGPAADARPEPDRARSPGNATSESRPSAVKPKTTTSPNNVAAFGGDRGDTAAGPRTGPGRLAESMRPELHDGTAISLTGGSNSTRRDASQTTSRPPSPGPRFAPSPPLPDRDGSDRFSGSSALPDRGGNGRFESSSARSDRGHRRPNSGGPSDKLDTIRRLMDQLGTPALSKTDLSDDESRTDDPSAGRRATPRVKRERPGRPGHSPEQQRIAQVDQRSAGEARRSGPGNTANAPDERPTAINGPQRGAPRTAAVASPSPPAIATLHSTSRPQAMERRPSATADPMAANARLRAGRTISRRMSFVEGQENLITRPEARSASEPSTQSSTPMAGENVANNLDPRVATNLPPTTLPPTAQAPDAAAGVEHDEQVTQLLIAPPAARPLATRPQPRLGDALHRGTNDLVRRVSLPRVLSAQHRPVSALRSKPLVAVRPAAQSESSRHNAAPRNVGDVAGVGDVSFAETLGSSVRPVAGPGRPSRRLSRAEHSVVPRSSTIQRHVPEAVQTRIEPSGSNEVAMGQARPDSAPGQLDRARAVRLPAAHAVADRLRVGENLAGGIPADRALMRTADRTSMRTTDRTSTGSTLPPRFQPQPSLSASLLASMVDRRTLQQPIDRVAPAPMQANRVRRSIVAPGSGALAVVLRHPGTENHPTASVAQRRGAPVPKPLSVTGRHESASSFGSAAGSEQHASAFQPGSRPDPSTLQARLDQQRPGPTRPDTIRRATIGGERAPDHSDVRSDQLASAESGRPVDTTPRLQRSLDRRPQRPPVADLGDRFLRELSQTIQRRPAPLPMQFRPMADEIAGGRSVLMSTDHASRRALRSVGKVAATVSDVIHFDPGPVPGSRVSEVIAHELTHIAHPSSKPRFFDDIDDSPEERKAEQVAKTMARSPLNPSASLLTSPKVGNSAPAQRSTIRRTPAAVAQARSAPVTDASGTVSAAALAAQMTGTSAPVQRSPAAVSAPAPAPAPAPAAAPSGGPLPVAPAPAPAPSASQMFDSPAADEWFKDQLRNNFSHIMNMIEDRMIEELERRGGRIWGGL